MSDRRPETAATGLRSLPRNVWVVTWTSFLTDVSSEMIIVLVPLYLSNVLGARTAAIGLIEGTAEATASVLKVFSGWLSDRIGQRKSLAVVGYALSTAAKPFLLLATSPAWVFWVRFADRFGKGIRTAPRDALVADCTAPSQRGLAFGVHRAGDTAGAVVGLLVALTVVLTASTGARLTGPVFRTLVLLCTLPAVLGVVVLAVMADETPHDAPARARPRLTLAPFDARFRRFLLVVVLFTLGNSSDAFLVLRAQQLGLSVAGVIGTMIAFNIVYTIVSGPAGALSDRVGRRRLMVSGWLVYALIYLGFAAARSPADAWLLMSFYGLHHGLTDGVARAYVADLVDPAKRGTAYGVFNAAIGLAALPASLIAGVLWQGLGPWTGFGPSAPFLFGAILAVAAAGLLVVLVPPAAEPV